jgi:hypothetical protein
MKTVEEIVARVKNYDGMFCLEDLVEFLPLKKADEFLHSEVDRSEWQAKELTEDVVKAEIRSYMEFACDKASSHRGLSAVRSIEHFRNWLWLLEDDEMLEFAMDYRNYPNYGAPILKAIAKKYDCPWPDDEGLNRMAEGKHCGACYPCGCRE